MPWSPGDAKEHYKGASHHETEIWAAAANNALKEYGGDEGRAIRVANAAINKHRGGGERRDHRHQDQFGGK